MATIFSPSALLSTSKSNSNSNSTSTNPPKPPQTPLSTKTRLTISPSNSNSKPSLTCLTVAAAAAIILSTSAPSYADSQQNPYNIYYGTAASAANYGGYGGNSDKKASAEYIYDVPDGWKERLVSKVEKGTNGTDSEFYNPKKKSEREYLTFLAGFRQLAPKDVILNNLALSDVNLQDQIASAESLTSQERMDEGQLYYDYEIDGAGAHSLISVTCANNKLYAHFVTAPNPEWNRDQDKLRHLHESFKTVG